MVSVQPKINKKDEKEKPKIRKALKIIPVKRIPQTITLTKKKQLLEDINLGKNTKKRKYIMPRKSIKEELVNSCLNAVLQLSEQNKKRNKIFEDETVIFAEIHCVKIQNNKGNVKFIFPHSTIASTGEVCLITPDLKKGRKHDHEPTIDYWETILRNAGITSVKTILPVRQLKVEYDQYELKRRLLTQHDFIMVDTRVLNHVSHLLGQAFFKKHNMLIPVRINEKHSIKNAIDIGLRTAMLRLNEGQTSTILVGHTGMPQNKLKENVISLIEQLADKYPGGEVNIRSISLKLPLSLSVPLYLTLRPSHVVHPPKLKHKKPKSFTEIEDEISTIPGGKVRVAPDGTVIFKREKLIDSDIEEDNEEENKEGASEKESDSE